MGTLEPASFWLEKVVAVVILLRVSARMSQWRKYVINGKKFYHFAIVHIQILYTFIIFLHISTNAWLITVGVATIALTWMALTSALVRMAMNLIQGERTVLVRFLCISHFCFVAPLMYTGVRLCRTAIAGLIEQSLGFNWHPRSFCRANNMHHHPVAKGEGAFEIVKFSTSVFRPPK